METAFILTLATFLSAIFVCFMFKYVFRHFEFWNSLFLKISLTILGIVIIFHVVKFFILLV
jgi:hypothetical protein